MVSKRVRIGDGKKDTTKTFPQISLIDLSCIPKTKAQVICAHYLPIINIYLIPFVCDHLSEMGKLISSIDRADFGAISPSLIPCHNLLI